MTKKSKLFWISSISFLAVSTGILTSTLVACSNNSSVDSININSYINLLNEIIKNDISNWTNANDINEIQNKIKNDINQILLNSGLQCTTVKIDLKSIDSQSHMFINPIKIEFDQDITCSTSNFNVVNNNSIVSINPIETKIVSENYINTIQQNILNNFNKEINTENCNAEFLDESTSLDTISKLSGVNLSTSDIQDLHINNLSNSQDSNLHLEIAFLVDNQPIKINIDTNVINPDSQTNLSYFVIDDSGNLTGLTEEGLSQTDLIIPSSVKYVNFPSNYAKNNITNAININFSFARDFIGFTNNDSFLNNNSIKTITFEGCSKFNDLKQGTFSRMKNLESINFHGCKSLTNIPKWAMDNCPTLMNINLNNTSINRISSNAFEQCNNLTSINLSQIDTALTIDNNAFYGCNNLTSCDLSNIISFTCGSNNFNMSSLKKITCTSELVYNILINKVIDKNIINLITQKLGNSIEYEIKNKTYEKSGFLKNAIERANDDSILYYSCNNNGVMHTYGTIAHILKVLEINPNKEMHLIMSDKVYNSEWRSCNLDFFENNPKFPNVHLYRTTLNEDSSGSLSAKYQYSISDIPEVDNGGIIDIIKKYNHQNDKNVLYTADVTFNWFVCLWNNIAPIVSSYTKNNCLTNYFNLFKMIDEVNVINDGTMSTNIYSNLTYNLYKTNDSMFYYDISNDTFPNLVELQKKVNQMSSNEFLNWLNESSTNFYYYMYSLISSGKSNIDGITKMKYYVASTDMVKDVNNISSTQFNDNVNYDEYFDPYNSQGFNFIDFFSSFKKETYENFLYVSGIKNVNNVIEMSNIIDTFNGKNNVIWIGDRIAKNSNIARSNAQRLVDLLKYHLKLNPNTYVYFKGHPREYKPTLNSSGQYEYWYVNTLLNYAYQIIDSDNSIPIELKSDYKSRIKVLDNQIPMEFFNGSNIIKNNSNLYNENTTFIEYCTYSTYVLSAEEYDFNFIDKILINNNNNRDIEKRFGNGNDSLCFPNSKKYII